MVDAAEKVFTKPRAPRFGALQYPNFRLFWIGNFISVIGTLIHTTGEGWLIRQLSPDPRAVTAVTACATVPILLLSLFSGVVADRVDRRRALMILNAIGAAMALILGLLVWTHTVQVWHVLVMALASGVILTFELPIRQTFYVDMVGKDALPNAITLYSSAFNAARVIGPAVGGMLIHGIGLDGCFLVNTFSFLAMIGGLALMKMPKVKTIQTPLRVIRIWRGVKYVKAHSTVLAICILMSFISFAAMSYASLLPIFARDIFHSDARTYALLFTFNGLGALVAAVLLATQRTMRHKGKHLLVGSLLFSIGVAAFAFAPNLEIAYALLFLIGSAQLIMLITANTLVQLLSPDHLRGRIYSIYSMAYLGSAPFGAIMQGVLAKTLGARHSVFIGAMLACFFSVFIFMRFRGLWKAA